MILINPQFDRVKKLGNFSRYVPVTLPTGIGVLAGYLLSQGKTIKILDDQITPVTSESLAAWVRDLKKPYLFGLSCFTAGIGRGYEIAKLIKEKYPDSKVIMGGIHPTVMPEECLNSGFVDIVVRREGDETLSLLYDVLKKGEDFSKIQGISFKDVYGKIIHNPDAPLFQDLNKLPLFPYHLFENNLSRYNLGFILSARGCPYDCIFCSQRAVSGRTYRYQKAERIMEEIDLLVNKYKQKYISFFDDNFVVNKSRTKELCQMIYDRGFHKKAAFDCQTRADAVDEEVLNYLKMANFKMIFFGLETASEKLMQLINKRERVEDNVRAVKLTKKFGFRVSAAFILGLPTETREERRAAYQMAKELDVDYVRFNNATPYPGTALYQIAQKEGRFNPGQNWENLSTCGTFVEGPFTKAPLSYVPAGVEENELRKDILRFNLLFWLRPKRVLRILSEGMVGGGWLAFPKRWYFKPRELYNISLMSLKVLLSLIKALL